MPLILIHRPRRRFIATAIILLTLALVRWLVNREKPAPQPQMPPRVYFLGDGNEIGPIIIGDGNETEIGQ